MCRDKLQFVSTYLTSPLNSPPFKEGLGVVLIILYATNAKPVRTTAGAARVHVATTYAQGVHGGTTLGRTGPIES